MQSCHIQSLFRSRDIRQGTAVCQILIESTSANRELSTRLWVSEWPAVPTPQSVHPPKGRVSPVSTLPSLGPNAKMASAVACTRATFGSWCRRNRHTRVSIYRRIGSRAVAAAGNAIPSECSSFFVGRGTKLSSSAIKSSSNRA